MKDEKKSLVVSDDSLWGKVKKFFANLFGKKENRNLVETVEVKEEPTNIDNQIERPETSFEKFQRESDNRNKITKLRKDFEAGNIHAEEMTDEEYEQLRNMYDDEIEKNLMTIRKQMKKIKEA